MGEREGINAEGAENLTQRRKERHYNGFERTTDLSACVGSWVGDWDVLGWRGEGGERRMNGEDGANGLVRSLSSTLVTLVA